MLRRDEIRIRDPYVVTMPEEGMYYLYGTTDKNVWQGAAAGFDVFRSRDLEAWEGPFAAFRPPADFWADRHFWAPEVHVYEGRYYMFASFKAEDRCRGTQILAADSPLGPFVPLTGGPVTPEGWECLDGTLYRDEQGAPWMVFCREWLQVHDGEMHAVRLSDDLRSAVGEPLLLFRASEAPWTRHGREATDYVTDGPFLHRTGSGELIMLWSSIGEKGYAIGISRSVSGGIEGPWVHDVQRLLEEDGGHGMLFRTLDGEWMLAIHAPNRTPDERPVFYPVKELRAVELV
ncbi:MULTISPECIES: glycoside hydrolase family 43 protein [Paenibacillus]|uniref:glycoside hydrolase family 43 protein n=1 Tax=Paenibacillus TaxID=44249 RepID=UPI0022B9269F|nr:glycoside hydrolase family 43 protein [Paenibacillus caseinilyticus]MCZ8518526.1 glycoside hydrolase family 43 protein [Paenibacillus caseinilyticus]